MYNQGKGEGTQEKYFIFIRNIQKCWQICFLVLIWTQSFIVKFSETHLTDEWMDIPNCREAIVFKKLNSNPNTKKFEIA